MLLITVTMRQTVHVRHACTGLSAAVHGMPEHHVDLPPPAGRHATDSPQEWSHIALDGPAAAAGWSPCLLSATEPKSSAG